MLRVIFEKEIPKSLKEFLENEKPIWFSSWTPTGFCNPQNFNGENLLTKNRNTPTLIIDNCLVVYVSQYGETDNFILHLNETPLHELIHSEGKIRKESIVNKLTKLMLEV